MKKATKQQGFTLIELMIVVAVIGVLAAVALPQYQKYVGKSEAASALATLSALRTNVEAYTLEKGEFPDTGNNVSLKTTLGFPTTISNAISTEAGVSSAGNILFTFNALADASPSVQPFELALKRDANGGWICVSDATAASGILPKGCSFGTVTP
jgi:type IV pilus assembly protein PilA